MLNILLGILIVVAVALTGVILMQQSEGGALGMGGGGQFMSARGASDLLTRTTQILAALFFILCIGITVLHGRQTGTSSVLDRVDVEDMAPARPAGSSTLPGFGAPAPTTATQPLDITAPAPAPATTTPFGAAPSTAPAQAPAPR